LAFVSKDEKFIPYFQVVGPETDAITKVSSTPLQVHVASKISPPPFVNLENSCAPFVSHDLASKHDVRAANLGSKHTIFFARDQWNAKTRRGSFRG
jgi:hypothetical protein